MNNKFKRGDAVKTERGSTKLIVVQYVNDPERKSVLKGDRETEPPKKKVLVEWKKGGVPRIKELLESELEFWTELE